MIPPEAEPALNGGTEPPLDPDYARVKALFNELSELPDAAARRARLTELKVLPALAERVLALLGHSQIAATHFSVPVAAMLAGAAAGELAPGDRLGAWTLLGELGRGGMGRVYLAERSDGHYQQRAAIKLLLGWSSEAALAQLAAERQILARLSHPHIARLIDGGATPLGRPYLVMDYVEGQRIDQYCREQTPNPAVVLGLFSQVCEAVAYAHRQLVVHCDIKPANVLVGSDGRALLLDFGIAQLQGKQGSEALALTPQYASPAQMAGMPATAADDIFSLGRMLGELLAGMPLLVSREDEWRAIVARATAADPEQRYLAVPALQYELRRFGEQRPLAALPHTGTYVARKFVRRRWPWMLAAGSVALLSAVFVLRLAVERDRALRAEDLAKQESATARQVSDFLVGLFEGADPNVSGRTDLSAASLVDKGRARIDADLQGQGAVQAALKDVLGKVYENIGRPSTALTLYEQALQLERAQPVRRPLVEAEILSRLANLLAHERQAARALAPARESVALRETRLPADSPELADSLDTLGWALTVNGAFDESATLLGRALKIREQHGADAPLALANTLHNLASMHKDAGRPQQAEALNRRALALKLKVLKEDHPSVLSTLNQLAISLADQYRNDEAQVLQLKVVAGLRALHGPNNKIVADALDELASELQDAGHISRAIATYREVLAVDEAVSGHQSMDVAVHLNNLATALEAAGDPAAEASYRESLAIRQLLLPAGDLTVARAGDNLGRWLVRAGRWTEARALLQQAAATRFAKLPPGHPDRIASGIALAEWSLAAGDVNAADRALTEAEDHQATLAPMQQVALWRTQAQLAQARAQPKVVLQLNREALALALRTVGSLHPVMLRLRLDLAYAEAAVGDLGSARATLATVQAVLAQQPIRAPLRLRSERLARQLGTTPGLKL